MKRKKMKKGFTLIETLISMGILAVIAGVVTAVLFIVTRSSGEAEITRALKQNGETAVVMITDFVRWSREAECSSTSHHINVIAADGGFSQFFCSGEQEEQGEHRIASRSGEKVIYLTEAGIECEAFQCVKEDNLIKFSFKLKAGGKERSFSGKVFVLGNND